MRRLKGEDNSFLAWESSVQPQHTMKAVVLDPGQMSEPLTFDRLKTAVQGWVDQIEPMQWQLLSPRVGFGRPWWVSRPQIDIEHHLQRTTAPAPGGDEELAATIGEIFEVALDRDRPAWQLWYVEGLADGRVALVLKIHHAVADGTASLRLLETLYSADPQTPLPQPRSTPLPNERRPAPWLWWPLVLRHQIAALARFPSIIARTAAVTGVIRRRQKAGKPGYAEAFAAPAMPFNEPFSASRRFAYRRCDVTEIKRVSKVFGVTINDVFLTICGGALRDYLAENGQLTDESMTAVVPVSMRPDETEAEWGNKVARWNVDLATHIADPVERLAAVASATRTAREVQAERDAWLQHDWMEYWPLFWLYSRVLPILGAKMKRRPMFSLIASNMRGPQNTLYWGGAPIEQLISSGPIVFPMGLNFTGWSYRDEMAICVLTCGDQVPDPYGIADRVPQELAELSARANSAGAGIPADPSDRQAVSG
ncbi:wax ester/triacylglycerol synthase family O-acyltransferase [Mycolicibacterium septicum DSM 44393]|uniref:Diacylglycerol O-acyltransferase n=2 Tax=Mycolicibacterium septicum TaxID=98668 RepID=A0A7X6MJR4_9MYCO|nr:wax ester/triacylglycerol synthase family O-acyltransferase [Mycolicibacterium septicum]NKZ09469.1 wax ester/triacylglycerol synthase family O-acyltransferase [Mycolicibacterium septicum DSM 44393]